MARSILRLLQRAETMILPVWYEPADILPESPVIREIP